MIDIIRITRDTCPVCIVLREIMKRQMPNYPEFNIIDYDEALDADEIEKYHHKSVPYLKCGDVTATGALTREQLKNFLEKCKETNR